MDFFNRITERFIEANRKLRKLHGVVSVLAAIVVFATTYALILPAITLDRDTASAQSGIEVAASDHETDSDGAAYAAEPFMRRNPRMSLMRTDLRDSRIQRT